MKLKPLLVEQERITGGEMHKSPSGAKFAGKEMGEQECQSRLRERNSKGKVEERKRNVPGIKLF